MCRFFQRAVLVASLLWVGSVSFSFASADQAFMIPRSDKVVRGELTFPDGSKARFDSRDGTWVTVEDRQEHYFFGFSGVVQQANKANFQTYDIIRTSGQDMDVKEQVEFGANRDVHVGRFVRFPGARGIKLSLKGIEEWSFTVPSVENPVAALPNLSPVELQLLYGVGASTNSVCCVACGDRAVCATRVSTSCGDCSSGGGGALYQ
mgnify:CR=1 FL=1